MTHRSEPGGPGVPGGAGVARDACTGQEPGAPVAAAPGGCQPTGRGVGVDLLGALGARCRWPPSPAVAAVSGGPDSLAMLVLARRVGLDLLVVHVDHGLRGGAEQEVDLVAAAAARYGARFEVRRVRVRPGPNLEARARSARYQVLPRGVMTAHTADDLAETMLLNLLRGAGADGLAALARRRAGVWRPLLDLRRHETEAVCALEGLTVVRDPSNDDLHLRRNAVRHRLLPLLDELAERDVTPVLARQASLLADEADLLDQLAAHIDPLDAASLRAAPPALARRAVRRWLRVSGGPERHPPSAGEVAAVLAVADNRARACTLSGGRRVTRSHGRLRLEAGVGEDPTAARSSAVGADSVERR